MFKKLSNQLINLVPVRLHLLGCFSQFFYGPARKALLRQKGASSHRGKINSSYPPTLTHPPTLLYICVLYHSEDMHVYTHRKHCDLSFFPFTTGVFFLPSKLASNALTNIMQRDQ